ncbi:cupin domain-containing protein [Kitasatospora sp. NPDC058201]|uniref:cupin domain-containing protein n=1 Tax=Streptomycetaceae TaxID=2062 RepID=UPI002E773943|nr:cupin domain-containing protein [Streptomyces sp. BE303]MED7953966.1 cupin domain-containing protein [Streptomyces sp. BE303]
MTADQPRALVVRSQEAERLALPAGGAFGLLVDADATGGSYGANRLTLGAGADGARPHHHAVSWELFYVLDGVAEFLLGDSLVTVAAGGVVSVPPLLPHAFGAAAGSPTDLLVVASPGVERFGYFRELAEAAWGRQPFDRLTPLQDRYDVHFGSSEVWDTARRRQPPARRSVGVLP